MAPSTQRTDRSAHFGSWASVIDRNFTAVMQAIVCSSYGPPEQLRLREVPTPVPKPKEVLVRVKAAAINDHDWSMVRGKPAVYRLFFGLFRPRHPIPGMEVAGVVVAVGTEASTFKVGDAVYGDTSDHGFGSFAEQLCIHQNALRLKPEHLSFAEAAATAHALCLAQQGLALGGLKPGMQVLMNGAGGGVGTFALQLAKRQGATVTGVDSGTKLEALRTLGFDHVLDFRNVDFTTTGKRYDLVLDAKSTRSARAVRRALAPGGVYVTIGGSVPRLLQLLAASWFRKDIRILAVKANAGLAEVYALPGPLIRPVIDGPYPLQDAPRLIRYFGEGKHVGKVVLQMDSAEAQAQL